MTRPERAWVLYDWANSAFTLIVTTAILPLYFKGVAAKGLEPLTATSHWGLANSLSSLALALMAPLLGTLADYPGYKKRFWLGFLLLGAGFTFGLGLTAEGAWGLCLILFFFAKVGFNGSCIFYDSFLVDVTERERMDWVSSSGYAWGYAGSILPFCLALGMIHRPGFFGFATPAAAMRASFILTAVWWLGFSLPMLRRVRQRYAMPPSPRPLRDSLARLAATLGDIRNRRDTFLFLLAYFFYIDGVDTIIVMATSFGADARLGTGTLVLAVLFIQVLAFPFALLYGRLARKTGAKPMLLAGIAVYLVIVLLALLLPTLPSPGAKAGLFWGMAFLVASSQGGLQALSRSYFGKLIPPESSAEFFGIYNIFGKFAAILGPLLLGVLGRWTGDIRYGILSLALLFLAGGGILLAVKDPSLPTEESPCPRS